MASDPRVYIPEACGLGRGEDCCGYLLVREDFICGRDTEMADYIRKRVAAGETLARRLPTDPRPDCQIYGLGF